MNIHFPCKVRGSKNVSLFILYVYLQFYPHIFYMERGDHFDTLLTNQELLKIFHTVCNDTKRFSKIVCADQS